MDDQCELRLSWKFVSFQENTKETNVISLMWSFILPNTENVRHVVYLVTVYQYNQLNCGFLICVMGKEDIPDAKLVSYM